MSLPFSEAARLVSEKLSELSSKASALYGVKIKPSLVYDLRGLAAGQASCMENRIRLNRKLLEKYGADFICQTVPHEFSHLVAYEVYGRRIKPHGNQWRSVMIALGAEPARTHKYEATKTRHLKRYLYKCGCPGMKHELTSIRHNRIGREAGYLCGKCGGKMERA